jgi:hypothetical protein
VERAVLWQVPSKYFDLLCHSFMLLISPQLSPSIIQGWYSKSLNDHRNSGSDSATVRYINQYKVK